MLKVPSIGSPKIFLSSLEGISWLLVGWILVRIVELADWDPGMAQLRVLASIGVLAFAAAMSVAARANQQRPHQTLSKLSKYALAMVAVTLFCGHVWTFWRGFHDPKCIDIPKVTRAAGEAIFHGKNPYQSNIDEHAAQESGLRFSGFKYGPLMALTFLPAALLKSDAAVLVINFLLDVLVAILVALLAESIAGSMAGAFAGIFFLSLPIVPNELFGPGVTDFAAIVPLLLSFFLLSPGGRGWVAGLSVSVKLLPAGLLLPVLFRLKGAGAEKGTVFRFLAGFFFGVVPMIGFYLWDPTSFVDNIFVFNMQRGADSTGWIASVPAPSQGAAQIWFLVIFTMTSAVFLLQRVSPFRRILAALTVMILFLVVMPVNHRNYQLWWIPFFSIVLGVNTARLWPRRGLF